MPDTDDSEDLDAVERRIDALERRIYALAAELDARAEASGRRG